MRAKNKYKFKTGTKRKMLRPKKYKYKYKFKTGTKRKMWGSKTSTNTNTSSKQGKYAFVVLLKSHLHNCFKWNKTLQNSVSSLFAKLQVMSARHCPCDLNNVDNLIKSKIFV